MFTDLWLIITGLIQGMMTRAMYEAHYWNAKPVRFEGDVLTVAMPSPRSLAATQRLNRLIIPAVEKQCDVRLVFVAEGCDAGVRGSRGAEGQGSGGAEVQGSGGAGAHGSE